MISFKQRFIIPLWECKESEYLAFHINGKDYSYSQLFDIVEQIYGVVSEVPCD